MRAPQQAAAADMPSDVSDEEADIAYSYRAPAPPPPAGVPASGVPIVGAPPAKKSHRHTASVASLIREGERVEEGWSPIGGSFSFPPTPTRAERDPESGV
jgi:hypothetical protein